MPSIDQKILKIFIEAGDHSVSGEDLARQLGLSRTAIWNHVEALRKAGYEIAAQPHLGYRLSGGPDRLIADEILARLKTRMIGCAVLSFEEVDSTNDQAARLAEEGAKEGTLILAESQRKGRGRLGRAWHSPKGSGLWSSLILRPALPPSEASRLTLLGALAVVRAIWHVAELEARIKWPNDVLLGGKKACGILSEMSSEPDRIRHVILGVGINVNLPASEFPPALRGIATSLSAEAHRRISRIDLLCAYLAEFESLYEQLRQTGFRPILEEIKKSCDSIGKSVAVKSGEKTVSGIAVDIDADGSLLLRGESGRVEKVYSGDLQAV